MDDDLRQRIKSLHDRAPEGRPDLSPVVKGGRSKRFRRHVLGSAAALVLVVVLVGGGLPLLPSEQGGQEEVANHEDRAFVPAKKGEPTYELYDFEIHYPWAPVDTRDIPEKHRDRYCSMRSEWECGHRREQAGFAYQWRWAANRFPGTVQCRVTLYGSDESVVGQETWEMSGLEPRSRPNRRGFVVPVHASGPPESATAECEAGDYPKGRGLRVTFVRAESYTPTSYRGETPPPDRIRLIFQAEALAEDHIDSRMCFMTVFFESGEKKTAKFTTNQRPGTWGFETGYLASDSVKDAKMRCRAVRADDSG